MSFLKKKKKKELHHLTIPQKKTFFHVKNQNLARVKHYVEVERIDINLRDVDDWSFLHHAANTGNSKMALYLLSKKCLINSKCSKGSFSGWTPLHVGAFKDDLSMVELLIGMGANVNAKNSLLKKPRDYGKRKVRKLFKNRAQLLEKYKDERVKMKKALNREDDDDEEENMSDGNSDEEESEDEEEEDEKEKEPKNDENRKGDEPLKKLSELKKVVQVLRVKNKLMKEREASAAPFEWEEGNETHKSLKDFLKVEGVVSRMIKRGKTANKEKTAAMLEKVEKRTQMLLKNIEKDITSKIQKVKELLDGDKK